MCEEASFIIVKGHRAVWSPYTDSHSEIRRERGIPENACGRITSVQVEVTPPRGAGGEKRFDAPLGAWNFRTDQREEDGELPEWWDPGEAEKAARAALEGPGGWAECRLVRGYRPGSVPRTVSRFGLVTAVLPGGVVGNVCGHVGCVMAGGEADTLYGTAGLVRGRVRSVERTGWVEKVAEGGSAGCNYGTVGTVNEGGTLDINYGTVVSLCGTIATAAGGIVRGARGIAEIGTVCRNATVRNADPGMKIGRIYGAAVVEYAGLSRPDCVLGDNGILIANGRVIKGPGEGKEVRVRTTPSGVIRVSKIT